jgi:hypothetical protein
MCGKWEMAGSSGSETFLGLRRFSIVVSAAKVVLAPREKTLEITPTTRSLAARHKPP